MNVSTSHRLKWNHHFVNSPKPHFPFCSSASFLINSLPTDKDLLLTKPINSDAYCLSFI